MTLQAIRKKIWKTAQGDTRLIESCKILCHFKHGTTDDEIFNQHMKLLEKVNSMMAVAFTKEEI